MVKPKIAYYRVSTDKQGISGLGLDSQKSLVFGYLREEPDFEYTEIETGKGSDPNRPQLKLALDKCLELGGQLIIANISRLARNSFFVNSLMNAHVDFVCCDMPSANPLMIQIMAAFAEDFVRGVSANTKNALKALKDRGVKLGAPKGKSGFENNEVREGKMTASEVRRLGKEAMKEKLKPDPFIKSLILNMNRDGKSLGYICRILNDSGYKSPLGGIWYKANITSIIKRAKEEKVDA